MYVTPVTLKGGGSHPSSFALLKKGGKYGVDNVVSGFGGFSDGIGKRCGAGARRGAPPLEVSAQLEGRVAIVTGGNSGIGRATALALAQVGARVVVAARREPEGVAVVAEIEAAGGGAVFVRTDVTKEADVERLIETALRAYGRLDVAFNNTGTDTMDGVSTSTAVTELKEADWDRIIDVDLKGCG
jgi:hypothetical protein